MCCADIVRGVGGVVGSFYVVGVELLVEGDIDSVDGGRVLKYVKYRVYGGINFSVGWGVVTDFGASIGRGFVMHLKVLMVK